VTSADRRAALTAAGALAVAVAARLAPVPAGLSTQGRAVVGVVLAGMLLWMTEALPHGLTALLVLGLLGTVPGLTPAALFGGFASPVVFFLVGALALGLAVERTGLAERAAASLVRSARGSPDRLYWQLLAGFPPLAFLLPSAITRNAILVPAYRATLAAMGAGPRTGRAVLLALAVLNTFASSALLTGGITSLTTATLLGGFTWARWFATMAVPYYALLAASGFALWRLCAPFEAPARPAAAAPAATAAAAGPLSGAERRALAALGLTSALWLTDTWHGLSPAIPALLGAALVLAPGVGVLTWKDLEARLSWGLLLTVGASLSLAGALETSGVAGWLAGLVAGALGAARLPPPLLIALLIALVALVHVGITNLAACIALLVPVATTAGAAAGLNPVVCGLVVNITVDAVILYPVQTASSLLAYEAGMFDARDVWRFGLVLWLVTTAVVLLVAVPWWGLAALPLARR
jgi:solute carrier family 13 (sodium-dependent dicarboxylate transporter), member 2/3/5